ncbi:vanadium-dependent haloperoxidase [Candidatus Dependentiae bacterium]|nr:vanadium-dependent haloperoxidase [Candidatus Dependentiae bacterium]
MNSKVFSLALLIVSPHLMQGNTTLKKVCEQYSHCIDAPRLGSENENKPAAARRIAATCKRTLQQKCYDITRENNGDEKRVPFFCANYCKGLQHSPVTGLLTEEGQLNYQRLLKALSTGKQEDWNAIERAPKSLKFANPQGAFTFSLEGADSASIRLPLFPQLSSPEAAAQILELYWMALSRDVFFNDYGTGLRTDSNGTGGSLTNDAARYLQALGSAYTGPRNQLGVVDAHVLFRCKAQGSLIGPYISQFFLLPLQKISYSLFPASLGLTNLHKAPFIIEDQTQPIATPHKDFNVLFADFVELQNGQIPNTYTSTDYDPTAKRFIVDGRDIASYVHFDHPYGPFYNVFNILVAFGFPLSSFNPYFNGSIVNEGSFFSLGWAQVEALIAGVSIEALKACWAHKWRAQRVLRPEAFSGIIQHSVATKTNEFKLDSSIFTPHAGINLLERTRQHNIQQGANTVLLSQAYREESPLHPAYPSGHATTAGACATVLKAFFDNSVKIKTRSVPVKPDPMDPAKLIPLVHEGEDDMTVASEIDKFACHIGVGRNFAGIHYRADLEQGLLLGEQVALKYLQDHAATQTEQGFQGFVLTKFDGTQVRVTAKAITPF